MAKIKSKGFLTSKDIIIQHAAVLFRKLGYASCSMRQIAETLGVEAPSLYNHIGSKAELLQLICFSVAENYNRNIEEIEQMDATATEKIELLIRFHIKSMINNFDKVYVSNHEWKQLQDPYLSNFLQQRRLYENRMVQLFQKGIRQKELTKRNPYITVLTILAAVRGLETWHRHKRGISAARLEEEMTQQLLNGIII